MECIKTNINGRECYKAALANNVKKVVVLSTDKLLILKLYGATKLAAEKLLFLPIIYLVINLQGFQLFVMVMLLPSGFRCRGF